MCIQVCVYSIYVFSLLFAVMISKTASSAEEQDKEENENESEEEDCCLSLNDVHGRLTCFGCLNDKTLFIVLSFIFLTSCIVQGHAHDNIYVYIYIYIYI